MNITFPYTPKRLFHKWGGEILCIHRVEHDIDKPDGGRSRDYWYYVCDVQWSDGSGRSVQCEVSPQLICYADDAGFEEVRALGDELLKYLSANGDWDVGGLKGWSAARR
jgi:hypothetical protein